MTHAKPGLQENNKYKFTLVYLEKGLISDTKQRLVLGSDSDSSRRDWAFSLMLASKWNLNEASKGEGMEEYRTKSAGAV